MKLLHNWSLKHIFSSMETTRFQKLPQRVNDKIRSAVEQRNLADSHPVEAEPSPEDPSGGSTSLRKGSAHNFRAIQFHLVWCVCSYIAACNWLIYINIYIYIYII